MTTATKIIYFSDRARGMKRWATHFAGRPGASLVVVDPDSAKADEGHGAGVYIEVTPEIGEAWDRGLRAPRDKYEAIERELNAVAKRVERS